MHRRVIPEAAAGVVWSWSASQFYRQMMGIWTGWAQLPLRLRHAQRGDRALAHPGAAALICGGTRTHRRHATVAIA
ncbi:protein of unknown function [Ectopseudomonas oleovorans]|nr:protein of unknown function [Pseudomonas oleovorans]